MEKILIAVDRSSQAKSVFSTAVSLAKTVGADLMLLHVLSSQEPDRPIPPAYIYHPMLEEESYQTYRQEYARYEQQGIELLQDLTAEASSVGIKTEYTQLTGNSGRLICELANSWSADLIIVGSRGLKGLKEMFLGSVSNYVTHHAPCSVLIVRDRADLDLNSTQKSETATAN